MRIITVLIVLALTGCISDQNTTGGHSGKGKADVVAQEVYNQIIDQLLSRKLTYTGNGSNFRPGMTIPYRNGMTGSHKAAAVCMVWNTDTGKASYKWASFSSGSSYSYSEINAINNCEKNKRQKSLNCRCQTIDHDDMNVLDVPDDFRRAYKQNTSAVSPQIQKVATNAAGEQKYNIFLQWEDLITQKQQFPILVKQVGKTGYAKFISLIANKKCDAIFRFTDGDRGDWEMTCTDGSRATGIVQALGLNKGSKGSGFDTNGHKLDFVLVPELM